MLSTSSRDSLPCDALPRRHRHQAGRISSRIVPEPSLSPQPLSRPPSLDDLHSPFPAKPSLRRSRRRAIVAAWPALRRPSPPCRIQMSLFSGPLRSPFTQPCAVTRRGRGREKDYGDVGEDERRRGQRAGSIRAPPTDTLARMSAPPSCFRAAAVCSKNRATVRDKIA